MRLLFLSNFYPPYDRGGMEQLCQEVSVRLIERGHSVLVLTSRYGTHGKMSGSGTVIRSLYLEAGIDYYQPLDFLLKRSIQERANALALQEAIERYAPDLLVVWGMWNLSRSLPFWAEQWMPGRVAYYIASTWPVDIGLHEAYWRLPTRHRLTELLKRPLRALALAHLHREGYRPELCFEHTMCCSRFIRDTLVQGGALPASSGVLYNGIDPAPFLNVRPINLRAQDGPLRLIYFGSLLPIKGVHTAIEALGLLKESDLCERVQLTILGSGHPDYEDHLRALVMRLGVSGQVHFAGRVPRDEIPSWLARFDAFLFISIGPEAMARTVMEAMAAGLLVIGSEVGGQVEMLANGQNSLTFRAGDAQALAAHIEGIVSDPGLVSRLAQAGQHMMLERFTLERMVSELEAWLKSVVR